MSLCWFRADGVDCILDEFRYLAWLVAEAGVPTGEIRTRRPGIVLWEDWAQIVAVPQGPVPRAFPTR